MCVVNADNAVRRLIKRILIEKCEFEFITTCGYVPCASYPKAQGTYKCLYFPNDYMIIL